MPSEKVRWKGFLSPVERVSETLFGLVMTLSITGTLSIVSGGREEIRTMILSVVGCNIAWGIIDAILYLLGVIAERGRGLALYRSFKGARDSETTRAVIAEALPPGITAALKPADIDQISRRFSDLPEPHRPRIERDDLFGAIGVFLLVVLSCVPILLPFFFFSQPLVALRASNGVAVVMMFLGGCSLALWAGLAKIWTGLAMVALGAVMVGLTIILGG